MTPFNTYGTKCVHWQVHVKAYPSRIISLKQQFCVHGLKRESTQATKGAWDREYNVRSSDFTTVEINL